MAYHDILGFKRPSFIKKVNYKDIVEELFNTDISSIPQEDEKIKKQIANVNYGMLEKSKNTAIKSFIFETLDEVKTFQEQYGGTVNIIKKYTYAHECDTFMF